jgi:integral membrane protein (TIGR00529 family)
MLDAVPAVVRLFLVFGLVLAAIRLGLSLGNAFAMGALILGLIFGLPPMAILEAAARALADPKTLCLSVIVSLILVLSHSLEASGQMERLLDRFRGLMASPRLNIVVFPALIGLLPMPGGAIFSAPMVKRMGASAGLSGAQLSFINYWFRHLWEYCWPLYPGVLLTTALARIDLWGFVLVLWPLTLAAAGAGYLPLRRMIPAGGPPREEHAPRPGLFLRELTPVLIAIVPGIVLGSLLEALLSGPAAAVAKELGLIAALAAAIGWVWHANGVPAADRRRLVLRRDLLVMVYMVAAILIFKGVLLDSRAVDAVSAELLRWRIPLLAIAVVLPFIVGFVVGITIAFVGATFPILISLIGAYGAADQTLAYLMLAMTGGFVGVLLSPLHLCLLLSNSYFATGLGPVYRLLWRPCLALLLAGLIYFPVLAR